MKNELAELFALQKFAKNKHLECLIEQVEIDAFNVKKDEILSDDDLLLNAAGDPSLYKKGESPHD